MLATIMRRGRTWPWIRMRPFLAQFSEPVWSGHSPSWADFITTTPVFRFSVHTGSGSARLVGAVRDWRDVASAGCVIVVAAFEAPTVVAGLDNVTVVGQAVEQRGCHSPNARSVVTMMDVRSLSRLTRWNRRWPP